MSVTRLNFINRSNDDDHSKVVIFQKPVSSTFDSLAVAWKTIERCGRGSYHPFNYVHNSYHITTGDSWGNYTEPQAASPGQRYDMVLEGSGDVLKLSPERASNYTSVEVYNALDRGSISANIYRSGRLLAQKNVVAPGQKAVFDFKPSIFIGVASEIEEGDVLNSAVLTKINKEISLAGITSADIVMTGGGSGPNATAYEFKLDNIKY